MWFKKLKKKKLQCFLIGLLLFLSALIFTTSLSIITSIKEYVNGYYNNDKYYNLIIYDANVSTKNDVINWCKSNPKVEAVRSFDAFSSGNNMYYHNEKIKLSNYDVIPLDDYKNIPFGISKIKALNNSSSPEEGEVWITQLFADAHKISLGDKLEFKTKDKTINLKVTSLINDSIQPSNLMTKFIMYINTKDIQYFSTYKKFEYTFINAKKNVNASELGKSLNASVDVGGFIGTREIQAQAAIMVSSIMGGVAGFASLLIFVVSIFLIRFFMWNNIIKEYKSIGIYKALGFTKKEIMKFYIIGYSLTAVIGSILGALCSIPVLNYVAAKVIKYIGEFKGIAIDYKTILITVVIFSLIVIINLYFVIKRTNKITPVEALRTGVTSSRKKLTKSFIKNDASSLALAINDILKYKKVTVYILLSLTISLSLIVLFGNLNFTVSKMKDNSNIWFGIPKSDVYISLKGITNNELKNILEDIESNKKVKNYIYGTQMVGNVKLDIEKYHINTSLYGITSMNSYSSNNKITTISGHNPQKDNEVAVSSNILKDSGLEIGDYIELSVDGNKTTYLISGSYKSLANNGYQIRMLNSEIEKYISNYTYDEIYVNLKNSSDISTFEQEINKKYSVAGAGSIEPNDKNMIETIPNLINPITVLLTTVFAIFSVVIIFNIIVMNLRDNRRNFGIMKALGFTASEIRNRYLYKILILTGISSILAVILNIMFSRSITKVSMEGLDVLIISPQIIVVSIVVMFILVVLTVLVCSRSIKNTKPTELIEE